MKRYYVMFSFCIAFIFFVTVTICPQESKSMREVAKETMTIIVSGNTDTNNDTSVDEKSEKADKNKSNDPTSMPEESINRRLVNEATIRQMTDYPQSTLQDLYKSFFQDRFGAGHIIADRQSAENYIQHEIESAVKFDGELAEPVGWRGNFVRVNLSLVKDGKIDVKKLTDALMRSADIEIPNIDVWENEWYQIENIIIKLYPQLPQVEQQHSIIERTLSSGNYALHHSDIYNNAYERHYRIIKTEIWQNEILPYLGQKQ